MQAQDYRPEYIAEIAATIQSRLEKSIFEIHEIYERTHVLSINARIEAARKGAHGVGFKVVADEFSHLNNEISKVSKGMGDEIQLEANRLLEISEGMAKHVRGQRLSQIALSIMDVIDRNLYERSCDVRWWATDSSAVNALQNPTGENLDHVSRRLGVILDSYTVYLDIVLVDADGLVVANGRPQKFQSQGTSVKESEWFKRALGSADGSQYSFESTHKSSLVHGQKVLAYGCRVDGENGASGRPLGVLGVLFNWEGLSSAVLGRVTGIDLKDDISHLGLPTVISVVDPLAVVLASTENQLEEKVLALGEATQILQTKSTGYLIEQDRDSTQIWAYGYSPGFETYATGWYCLIRQKLKSGTR